MSLTCTFATFLNSFTDVITIKLHNINEATFTTKHKTKRFETPLNPSIDIDANKAILNDPIKIGELICILLNILSIASTEESILEQAVIPVRIMSNKNCSPSSFEKKTVKKKIMSTITPDNSMYEPTAIIISFKTNSLRISLFGILHHLEYYICIRRIA